MDNAVSKDCINYIHGTAVKYDNYGMTDTQFFFCWAIIFVETAESKNIRQLAM